MNSKIILPNQNLSREAVNLAGLLLSQVAKEFPRIAPNMAKGVTVTITTAAGDTLQIGGKAGPTPLDPKNGALIV